VSGVLALLAQFPGALAHDSTGMGGHILGQWLDPSTRNAVQGRIRIAADRTVPLLNVKMVGQPRADLFGAYIRAVDRGDIICPRIEPYYTEHKFCAVDDLFGNGHPPDSVVAMALAYHAFRTVRAPGDLGMS
jgi:hypothetical protein